MSTSDDLTRLEARITELEKNTLSGRREEARALWENIRYEEDPSAMLERLRETVQLGDARPKRAVLHGTIEQSLNNPGGPLPFITTITVSSEPCSIVVATIISAIFCDD